MPQHLQPPITLVPPKKVTVKGKRFLSRKPADGLLGVASPQMSMYESTRCSNDEEEVKSHSSDANQKRLTLKRRLTYEHASEDEDVALLMRIRRGPKITPYIPPS